MQQPSRKILIVDDSPEDCELYRRYLRRDPDYSYTILEASLGWQGLELWQQQRPDLVLLDYRLPDLDGLEFLAQLPSPTPQPCLPVIVLTGQGNETIAVQALKAGAQDYLIKGQITPEGLHLAIHGAIETVKLRTELQQRIERERVVGQITRQIHQSLDLDRILQTTVTEVRQFLKTDRVLVFQLQPDGNGTVVAESVDAPWRSLLSSTIHDPCLAENYLRFSRPNSISHDPEFAEDYVKRYRQGQVTAIPDIHSSDINPCHIELLAQLQVKANLVVPILHDDRFWGLLIAHHCTATRLWQPLEIDLLKELATQMGIALRQAELYQQSQLELAERNQAEIALRESEQRYATLSQISPVGIFRTDVHGDCLYTNARWCELTGLSPEAAQGKGWIGSLHPDDHDRIFAEWYRAAELNLPFLSEYRFQTPDGRVSWVIGQAIAERDVEGRLIGYVGTVTDITDRKQVENALQESESRFRQLAENIDVVFWMKEVAENRVSYVSPAYERLWGLNPQELYERQQSWIDYIHSDDRESIDKAFQTKAVDGLFDEEYRIILPNGQIRWVHDRCFPLRNQSGETYRFTGIAEDITDRKLAEDALRQSEEFNRRILESSSDCIKLFNLNGQLLYMNPGGLCMMEIDDLCPYINVDWASLWQEETRATIETAISTAKTGELTRFQGFCPTTKGTPKWWDVVVTPIFNTEGQVIQLLAISRDITDRKQSEMERELLLEQEQAARESAERANRIKDDFLAVLSHELRSPLNPILGWTKLMQRRKLDTTKTNEALATIERNVKLQSQLIDDLLDVAKILRGKLSMNVVPVDLAFTIEAAIDTVRTAAVAKEITLHAVLPQIGRVSGDSARLQQIVWNLLSNAIKFTPVKGQVEVRLERDGNQAKITVSDTGKGINPDFLPHIFESFRQEDASTTRQFGGLGLGLAIVRHLVEAHGGTIYADSPGEGQGATFILQLPLLDAESEQPLSKVVSTDELDLTGIRILAIDDELDAREMLTALLTQYGAEVLTGTSATEALADLEWFQPDVLISDIGMPEVDGYMLMQQIRALPPEKGGQILAIALTAYAREEDRQQAINNGYQRHLTKPLDIDRLVQVVVELTRNTAF